MANQFHYISLRSTTNTYETSYSLSIRQLEKKTIIHTALYKFSIFRFYSIIRSFSLSPETSNKNVHNRQSRTRQLSKRQSLS